MTTDAECISPGKNTDVFIGEEELRFSRRHDEGYDLYADEHYLAWLIEPELSRRSRKFTEK